jgi:hypothetical protein
VVCLAADGDAMREALEAAALLIDDGDADEALVVLAEQEATGDDADRATSLLVRATDRRERPLWP